MRVAITVLIEKRSRGDFLIEAETDQAKISDSKPTLELPSIRGQFLEVFNLKLIQDFHVFLKSNSVLVSLTQKIVINQRPELIPNEDFYVGIIARRRLINRLHTA
jgi:hypothetical protein